MKKLFFGIIFKKELNELDTLISNAEAIVKYSIDYTKIPKAKGVFRDIQMFILRGMEEIDFLCRNNSIEYWLDFGSLLGAVRHKGFIPWDYSFDIAMLREDQKRFITIVQKYLQDPNSYFYKEKYRLEIIKGDKLRYRLYFMDNVFIDIYAYYELYISDDTFLEQLSSIITLSNLMKYEDLDKIVQDLSHKFSNSCNNKEKKRIIFFPKGEKYSNRKVINYNDYFPLKQLSFEEKSFFVPKEYEKILFFKYRDYFRINQIGREKSTIGLNKTQLLNFMEKKNG